jgi:DNA polymerase I-like protein with 3'-5' exonuclease and polymerase domains
MFPPNLQWIQLEHRAAEILAKQEVYGWQFDVPAAQSLDEELRGELESLKDELISLHPYVAGEVFTPKRPDKTRGYVAGAQFTKLVDFNPTSRDHIAWVIHNFDHKSLPRKTEKGKTVIDETVLKDLGTPKALKFFRLLTLQKQLGLISEGKNAWLRLVRDGRLHHHCSVGAATFRCSHRGPNLAQVPSDLRFRRLFTASPGLVMVGADLQAIELRMLAHYLFPYDSGEFAHNLLNDDIHQVNADKIGISRKLVKTVTYAFLYGASDKKIGLSYDPSLSDAKARTKGKEIRKAFMDAINGLERLSDGVRAKAITHKHVRSIDSRAIPVDSPHKALNYLLQGGAGVVAKQWMIITHDGLRDHNHQLAFVHDELQFETVPEDADNLGKCLELCAEIAGQELGLRLPIAAESKIGPTWADVH